MNNVFELKNRLKNGEAVFGTFYKGSDPNSAEILGYAGFDFAIIDCEHSTFSYQMAEDTIRACQLSGMAPVVRVNGPKPGDVHHYLESGAIGVQIPSITSVKDAVDCVDEAAFFPKGHRSPNQATRSGRFTCWNEDRPYKEIMEGSTLRIVQVESVEMADAVEELCSIPEIDVLFIGPGDLSMSMGKPGKLTDPEVEDKIRDIIERGLKGGKIMGMLCGNSDSIKKYYDMGVRYIAYSNDRSMLANAAKAANEMFAAYRA